jgi:3-phosphoshikimate 1-carboxyvinyltransferase
VSETLHVEPARRLTGDVDVPGDKSVSHRALLMAALCRGTCELRGILEGEDCLRTRDALGRLGTRVRRERTGCYQVEGAGWRWAAPEGNLDLGNSGTGMRLLAGILAGQPFPSTLSGDRSLSRRPMGRIIRPLRLMGAEIRGSGAGETPPLTINGRSRLKAVRYQPDVASAQVKSCVLLAGLFADGPTCLVEPLPTRDHTERLFAHFGISVDRDGSAITVDGSRRPEEGLPPAEIHVPGDPSSAAFLIAGAASMEGSDLTVGNMMLNPTRIRFLDVLRRMGAEITVETGDGSGSCPEPVGRVRVRGSQLVGTTIEAAEIPLVIDEIPILAVAAARAGGLTRVRNAEELRVKESDRIAGVVAMLRAFGQKAEEHPTGFDVEGGATVRAASFDSRGDHRLAMAAAMLALHGADRSEIDGAAWITTSFPGFAELLARVSRS